MCVDQIDWCVIEGVCLVGVMVGVFVFEVLVNEVIDVFCVCYDVMVDMIEIVCENVEFKVLCVLWEV